MYNLADPKVTVKGTIRRLREMKKRHADDIAALETRIALLQKKKGKGDDDDDDDDDDDSKEGNDGDDDLV